jgi:SHS2 domain-containing protein
MGETEGAMPVGGGVGPIRELPFAEALALLPIGEVERLARAAGRAGDGASEGAGPIAVAEGEILGARALGRRLGDAARSAADTPADPYFDHDADVGVVGREPTLERAFEAAAAATFALMVDPAAVRPLVAARVAFDEADPELALVAWLNRLLAAARERDLALARFRLRRAGDRWRGAGWGEPWRPAMERGVEVKGATLTELAVGRTPDGWTARCVVDV